MSSWKKLGAEKADFGQGMPWICGGELPVLVLHHIREPLAAAAVGGIQANGTTEAVVCMAYSNFMVGLRGDSATAEDLTSF